MKLSFVNEFLSVKNFDGCELDNFSVITGLNGSGKTHLLLAINRGHIKVENIDPAETLYFNYGSFVIDTGHEAFGTNYDTASSKRRSYFQLHNTRINKVWEAVSSNVDYDLYEIGLLRFFRKEYRIESKYIFGEEDAWKRYITNDFDKNALERIKDNISTNLNEYLAFLIEKKCKVDVINELFIDQKLDKIKAQIKSTFNDKYPDYLDVLSKSCTTENIFKLTEKDFELGGLFISELQSEIKSYLFSYADYLVRKAKSEIEENNSNYTLERFNSVHGANPINFLNEILDTYDCNGYQFTINDFFPQHGIAANSITIPLQLQHKNTGLTVDINTLSSGEQTLLSLAMMIYKAKRKGILPRLLLLDEVDTALHPSMIKRLLSVIENIFITEKGLKVILSTHSPTTIALAPESSVFLLERGESLKISKRTQKESIELLTEGFATLENSLSLLSYITKNKVTIFSEGDNEQYLKKANTFFGSNDIEVIAGISGMTGKNQLKILFEFFQNVNHDTIVYFVWDCDVKTKFMEKNKTIPFIFPINNRNDKVLSGIENLFSKSLFEDRFYTTTPKDDGGEHKTLSKKKFMQHIVANGTKDDFVNFKPLFDDILSRLK